jgi:hypothetical protein
MIRARHSSIRRAPVKFKLGQHVRISKEKLKFAKGCEQNYTTEIFRIQKVVSSPVYELVDLLGKHIDGQFYGEELTPVIVPTNRAYPILKILRKRVRNGSIEYLVGWVGYSSDFVSWMASSSKKTWPPATNPHTSTSLC